MDKKQCAGMIVLVLLAVLLTSCGTEQGKIVVVTREDGSGTRAAMTELLGFRGEEDITLRAEVVNTNAVMLFSVAGCGSAIGYVSAGVISGDVRSVCIDGVCPSPENIRSGLYPLKRSFHLVINEKTSEAAKDFIAFAGSAAGEEIISGAGYVPPGIVGAYTPSEQIGKIVLAGSTSVAPLIESLADAYTDQNPDVHIEVQQIGSSAGIASVQDAVCDIGMSSRDLTDAERSSGLSEITVAYDGIAVIVHKTNGVRNLSLQQVRQIFSGEITVWPICGELGKDTVYDAVQ